MVARNRRQVLNKAGMLERFRESLRSCGVSAESGVLLAVSGGSDSTAMLHLFRQAQEGMRLRLEIAHLHHGIRGTRADGDGKFVEEECRKLGLPFRSFRFDVPRFAKRRGLSLEEAGRRIRRHFFRRAARLRGLDFTAFAHTADDQAETVLLNFLRGAGLRGLSGISPRRGRILHPLLSFSKSELREFLTANGLSWREDETNRDPCYSRNKIRLEIMPFLENQTGIRLKDSLCRAAALFRAEEEWMEELVSPLFQERFRASGGVFELKISPGEKLPPGLRRRLVRKFLETSRGSLAGITFSHVERILDLLSKPPGRRFEFSSPPSFVERTPGGVMFSVSKTSWTGEVPVKIPGETKIPPLNLKIEVQPTRQDVGCSGGRNEAFLDSAQVEFPVWVRTRRPGDSFCQLGFENRGKKLQDYFVDRKVPRVLRDRIPLLVCPRGILWVGGYDIGDRFKVTPETKNVLHFKIVHDERN